MKKRFRWFRTHRKSTLLILLVLGLLLFNLVVFIHAWAQTHYVQGGTRTQSPLSLSVWQKAKVLVTGVRVPRPVNETDPGHWGLDFTTHRSQARDGSSLEAWHVSHPRSRGLVLLFHGYAASKDKLLPEARAFHDLGLAVFLVDFRGSGGSSGCETTIGVEEANDVAEALRFAQDRWPNQPLILFGQSMGAAAILRALALDGFQPQAIVLESPFDRLLSTVKNRFSAMGLPAFPAAHLLVFWGGVQQGNNGFRHNPVDYAAKVHCPALLLHGEVDPWVTLEEADSLFQNLGGPKRFEVFPGLGHEPFVTAQPESWKRLVSQFLWQDQAAVAHLNGKK